VKRHIQVVVSSAPSRAVATLENDASELIASGMVTLNAKLSGIEDEKLVARVVEIWGFFWDQVLTYLEGVRTQCNHPDYSYVLMSRLSGAPTSSNGPTPLFIISHSETDPCNVPKPPKPFKIIKLLNSRYPSHRCPVCCLEILPRQGHPPPIPASIHTTFDA